MSTVQMIVGGVGLLTYGLFILYFLLKHGWDTLDRSAAQSGRLANARGMEKWFSRLVLVTAVCMAVYFGGAKPSGGSRGSALQASSRLTSAESVSAVSVLEVGALSGGTYYYDLLSGESFGPITCPTNLAPVTNVAFFGVSPSATSVWLGVAWPCDAAGTNGQLDVYANWQCASQGWKRFAEIDVSAAHSNVVAELDWPRALDEAVLAGEWPTNATSAAGFFQAAIDRDTDGDGISDGDEKFVLKTNPLLTDTDGDGDDDYWEIDMGFDPRVNEPGISQACVPVHVVTNTSTAAHALMSITTSSADGVKSPVVQIDGELDPDVHYSIVVEAPAGFNITTGAGLTDIQVVPDLTSTVWKSTGDHKVVYTLFADGVEKSSASCVFRSQPPKEDTSVGTMCGTNPKNGCVEFTHGFGSTPRYGCKTYVDDVLILDEAMTYGVTASGQRTKRHARTAGGVTRVSYEVYDALSRRVLSASESGRARTVSYADTSDGAWTETEDTGVWSEADGFVLVSGRSLREVREKDAKGDVVSEVTTAENCETQTVTRAYDSRGRVPCRDGGDGRARQRDAGDDGGRSGERFACRDDCNRRRSQCCYKLVY